jgi:hypothetical protein
MSAGQEGHKKNNRVAIEISIDLQSERLKLPVAEQHKKRQAAQSRSGGPWLAAINTASPIAGKTSSFTSSPSTDTNRIPLRQAEPLSNSEDARILKVSVRLCTLIVNWMMQTSTYSSLRKMTTAGAKTVLNSAQRMCQARTWKSGSPGYQGRKKGQGGS